MKIIPTEALEVALYSPSLDQLIVCLAKLTAYRLTACLSVRVNGGILDLITQDLASSRSILSQRSRIKSLGNIIWSKPLRLRYQPGTITWKRSDFLIDPNLELWFIDGSNVNDRFGAGIYESRTNHKGNISKGGLATVFQAKVLKTQEDSISRIVRIPFQEGKSKAGGALELFGGKPRAAVSPNS